MTALLGIDEYRVRHRMQSAVHEPGSRPCVHLLAAAPPPVLMLDRDAVASLNFQPRVCPAPMACIASRVGDVLTIAFDKAGPIEDGASHAPKRTTLRWHYRLEATDNPNVVAAVMLPPNVVVRNNT